MIGSSGATGNNNNVTYSLVSNLFGTDASKLSKFNVDRGITAEFHRSDKIKCSIYVPEMWVYLFK